MRVYIGTDHRGVELEKKLVDYLLSKNYEVVRSKLPHYDTDDYIDFAKELGENVVKDQGSFGILICRTGIGMSIVANKIKGIRAARCVSDEDAYLTRFDNDANVLCLSYDDNYNTLLDVINVFLNTKKSDEERHIRRVNKIIKLENGEL